MTHIQADASLSTRIPVSCLMSRGLSSLESLRERTSHSVHKGSHALQGKVVEMQKTGELHRRWESFQSQEYSATMVSCLAGTQSLLQHNIGVSDVTTN